MILRRLDQRLGVLGKAGAAIAWSCVQEFGADALVEADPARHVLHIRARPLAEVGDFVDERYFSREKSVRRIFCKFGCAAVGEKEGRLIEIQRPVDFPHDRFGALVLDPDDNAVGPLEIIDGRPFTQKFRVGHDREIGVGPGFTDDSFNLIAGADGHGGFCHDHRKPLKASGDRAGRLVDK